MSVHVDDARSGGPVAPRSRPTRRWTALALPVAATWSLAYLGLGIAWLLGAGGNPADPAVDEVRGLSLLGLWSPRVGAGILTGLAGFGVVLAWVMAFVRPGSRGPDARPPGRSRSLATTLVARIPSGLAIGLGLTLAVVLPDYRLLATIAYTPIMLVLTMAGAAPEGVVLWYWPVVNMAVLSVAGLAWFVAAIAHHRRITGGCAACGRSRTGRDGAWTSPAAAARWGRWAVGVAVAIPVGYAATRYAWALGIPWGVTQELLDELGAAVYLGAGLATLAVAGAILTLGLVQRWGEVFPWWMVGLRGRRVPVMLAVVPAGIVSVVVASAGVMFVRFAVTGRFAAMFPGGDSDVAGWLPEMFWPLWGAALAAAAFAYWLRRRGDCAMCGSA
ncbi:NYN domain-containing protein [Actinopolymorpha sp. B17G11]|uniref:NYN domain-containing protein n=1 Tax=unclassified Actinopolymorpha TaxID=2627063 RepID=UPI0032D99A14